MFLYLLYRIMTSLTSLITLYKYRIYCTTNSQWEYLYSTTTPTDCPINNTHTINLSSVSILDQITAVNITTDNSPYSVSQNSVLCDTSSGNIILNLPKAERCTGIQYIFKKTSASNTVTITPYSLQLIDGLSIKTLSSLDETVVITSNGINWITGNFYNLNMLDETNDIMISTRNKGDLFIDNSIELTPLPIGNNNNILLSDSLQTQGMKWSTLNHSFLVNGGENTHTQIDTHINSSSNIHGITGTIVTTNANQILTNKTLTDQNNTIRATHLGTTDTDIQLTNAIKPSTGNFLTATTSTIAAWQTLSPIPGGNTTQIQYNNNQMDGSTGMTIDSDGTCIIGQFNDITPNIPSTGSKIFSRYKGGRQMSSQQPPSGIDYSFQPFFGTNKIGWWSATGNGTLVSTINFNNTITGTATTRNMASTNLFTNMRRVGYVSASTPGSSSGTLHGAQQFWRGNASGLGGFFYVVRFGSSSTNANQRFFIGLIASTTVIGNVNPSTLTNILAFAADSADANFSFMHNDNTGTATKKVLTGNVTARTANTDMYEVRIFCAPNGLTVYYSIENLSNPSYSEGFVTTDLPTSTTLLSTQIWTNNGAGGGASGIDIVSQYMETDN